MIEHELVDFVGLAAVLTNEQKILAALLRIEVLLAGTKTAPEPLVVPKGTAVIGGRRK